MNCEPTKFLFLVEKNMEGSFYEIKEFPELEIICRSFEISLCPSFYGKPMTCFRAGGIDLNLYINGIETKLSSQDGKNTTFETTTDQYRYTFKTLKPVLQMDKLYLLTEIIRCPIQRMSECSFKNSFGCNFKVGEIFKISMGVNYTTGTTISIRTSDGLEMIDKNFILASEKTGSGGMQSYTFRAKKSGLQSIWRRYDSPGKRGDEEELKIIIN